MRITPTRYAVILLVGLAVCLVLLGTSLLVGSENLWEASRQRPESVPGLVMSRLDRALAAALVGAALALSGAVFQALLRNPLADPYILGVSGGASLGVILSTIFVPAAWFHFVVPGIGSTMSLAPVFGFGMALLTVGIVYAIAQRKGRLDPYRLILTGVIVNAFYSAAIMLTAALAGDRFRNAIIFWLMGGLGSFEARWAELALVGLLIAGAAGACVYMASGFNLMSFGEEVAASLGLDVERRRRASLVVAALLAGLAVSLAGPIGFVGLIVPHLLRLTIGADHRLLVPLSVFGGAAFLMIADRVVQVVPYELGGELPVGVVTALCGVPFFILLMRRSRTPQRGSP